MSTRVWHFAFGQGESIPSSTRWNAGISAAKAVFCNFVLKAVMEIQPQDRELLRKALESGGLQQALGFLNRRVEHRYTAVYRLKSGVLHNACLEDKKREVRPEYLAAVPLGTSFCQFVLRDGVFATSNSAEDRRLDGHPYQGAMVAYTGVPLTDASGELIGTICHFDVTERSLSDSEFQLLQLAARLLPGHLPRNDV